MTGRQKVLKTIYPAFTGIARLFGGRSKVKTNTKNIKPGISFYSLNAVANNDSGISFDAFKGKKVLIVNTASDCGYTAQYAELQQLYEQFKGKLVIVGFPSNDFQEQEKGTDQQIASFCKVNYGVSFPLAKKSVVIKTAQQDKVFQWLSDSKLNGWNDVQPSWNFSKYLIDEQGILTNYFQPYVSPLGSEVIAAVEK